MSTPVERRTRWSVIAGRAAVVLSLLLSGFSLATVLSAPAASVTVPNTVGFEGYLIDSGEPADGTYSMTFAVYDAAIGGELLWDETQSSVEVDEGIYSVELGLVDTLPADLFDGARWIGVTIGTGSEMQPRTKVSSVPFAINAEEANNADTVDDLHAAASGANAHVLATDGDGDVTVDGEAAISDGLNLGTAAGAGAGDLFMSGSIEESTALGCRAIRTQTQSLPTGQWTALSFNSELHDTGSCWSSGQATRLYAPADGYYMAGGGWNHSTGTYGNYRIMIAIRLNGTTWLQRAGHVQGWDTELGPAISSGMFWMDEGDYIEILAWQDCGGGRTILAASSTSQHNNSGWLVRLP